MAKRILIADDSVTIQKAFAMTFAGADDVTVTGARSADEGLALAQRAHPDLIIADGVMPGRSGYDLCASVKADPALRAVPVYILASPQQPYDDARGQKAGADGQLTKPWETNAMMERVRSLLGGGAAVHAPAAAPAPGSPTVRPRRCRLVDRRRRRIRRDQHRHRPRHGADGSAPAGDDAASARSASAARPRLRRSSPSMPAIHVAPPQPHAAPHAPPPAPPPASPTTSPGMRPSLIPGMRPGSMPPARPGTAPVRPLAGPAPVGRAAASRGTAHRAHADGRPGRQHPHPGRDAAEHAEHAERARGPRCRRRRRRRRAHRASRRPSLESRARVLTPPPRAPAAPSPAAVSASVDQKLAAIAAKGPEYEAIAKLSREVIEQVVWEIVPELAEAIIREHLEKRGRL